MEELAMSKTEIKNVEMMVLNTNQLQIIINLAKKLRKSDFAEFDEIRLREDFYGLQMDIVRELSKKGSIVEAFFELSEVLNEIKLLLTPVIAYKYGWNTKETHIESEQGFINFMRDITKDIEASGLFKKRDNLFYDLCDILGETRSLMTEYLELHDKISVEQYHIKNFFDLGYSDAVLGYSNYQKAV